MTELVPSVVPLVQGLDLVSPKIVAPPGSMLACSNYELVDFSGYRRIDGYERYDGKTSPSITRYYRYTTEDPIDDYVVGDILGTSEWFRVLGGGGSSPKATTSYLGVVVDTYTEVINEVEVNVVVFVPYVNNTDLTTAVISEIRRLDTATETLVNPTTVVNILNGYDAFGGNTADYVTQLLAYQEVLRNLITPLPSVPVGLHWYDDRLYAVAGAKKLIFSTAGVGTYGYPEAGASITSTGGGTALVLASDITSGSSPKVELTILDYYTGTWEGETVAGVSYDPMGLDIPLAINSVSANETVAHLWEARSDVLTISEELPPLRFGWKPVFHNWIVDFDNGNVAAGFYDKVERNQDNLTPSTYYFSDGTTTLSAQVLSYRLSSGDLTLGTGAGTLQLGELTNVAGPGYRLDASYTMYSDLALTTVVGEISAPMEYNYLPGIEAINNFSSRYEFITSNFYGSEALETMYGVSGAGYAFYFDKNNFYSILTGTTVDAPRHIVNHLGHLALSYQEGSVLLSVVGEPWNFDAAEGASEIAVGDTITGLCTLNGTTLAVFCSQSVMAVSGSNVDSFTSQVLSPNVGCIEYSLVSMGQPVFCTNWGISTLEQSDKYGDFVGARLSQAINPWLLDRLVDKSSGRAGSAGVLCAIPVRAKNQYRLFLKDGNIVTMTLAAGDQPAGFTLQKYYWPSVESDNLIKPIATSSQIDNFGRERIHFSTWDLDDGGLAYVFEGDIGWSFDGKVIEASFDTNWYFAGSSVTRLQTVANVRLHGLIEGQASLAIYSSGIEMEYNSLFSTTAQPINLDRNYTTKLFSDYQPATNIVDLAKRGLGIQYRIATTATTPEPPHVLQVLTVQMRATGSTDS